MAGGARRGVTKICKACDKEFYVPQWRKNTAKFCSLICQNHLQYKKTTFICLHCNKQCEDSPSRKGKRKFCSTDCLSKFSHDRKIDQKVYRREKIKKLRREGKVPNHSISIRKYAFEFKEKKCQVCEYSQHAECLDVHHKDNDPNNNSLENLIILCVMCHRKVHRKIITL